jgi:integrase
MAETILETAVRRAEMAAWRVDTLPLDSTKWKVANPEKSIQHQAVLVELMFNTKGAEYGRDSGDKIGPRGIIRVPMPLAFKLHEYREKVRPKALTLAIRKARSHKEAERIRKNSVHLFLNPRDGNRYTGSGIYEFWRSVERPAGWSPHLARDFWACSVLWKSIQDHKSLLEQCLERNIDSSLLGLVTRYAESCIQLIIQPQLRHASKDTTMTYLQWLSDRLAVNPNFHENWVEKLSQENDSEKQG